MQRVGASAAADPATQLSWTAGNDEKAPDKELVGSFARKKGGGDAEKAGNGHERISVDKEQSPRSVQRAAGSGAQLGKAGAKSRASCAGSLVFGGALEL
ncbi:hypothetical protein NLG97_g4782 [Lecanicillium saksenae]|uniref:Uncharacterized protein n=1 Tax=Lecanicillium saksenae TaxID=468837 RepID=A0ACC1QW15_9HYPO|nr:hypothetical protein NLG97_g4782 [Lecanicillium saksenae]